MARPSLPQFEPEYDYYKLRQLVDELNRWIDTVEAGESGATPPPVTGVHNDLTGRDAADAHPQSAITDLVTDLAAQLALIAAHIADATIHFTKSSINHQLDWSVGMSSRAFVFSDFFEPTSGLQTDGLQAVGAAGGFVSTPTLPYDFTNHPGVWGLNSGAGSAVGRLFLLSQFLNTFHVGVGGLTRMGFWFQAPAILSTALQRYVIRAGVASMALPNTILQGILFEYQDDQNGGRWQAICDDAPGVETSVDTGILVVASTYYFLEIEVNAAGTSVEFFIDSVSVATIATNIPSGTGFGHFISVHIMKLIGLGNRAPYIDAYYVYQEVTR